MDEGFGDASTAGGPDRHGKGKGKRRQGKMGPPVERGWAEKWRIELKIAGVSTWYRIIYGPHTDPRLHEQRQFSRLVEMLQLRALDETDVLATKAYRLQVKERLYRFNFVRSVPFPLAIIFLTCFTGGIDAVGEGRSTTKAGGDVPVGLRGLSANPSHDSMKLCLLRPQ